MPVSGAVDAVLGRFVVGWAHDPEDLERRVEVELELDGELIGSATADLERGDLLVAKIGDGCHAFRIELPQALEPGSEHVLGVRTSAEGIVLPLANDFVVEFDSGQSGSSVVVAAPAPVPDAWLALTDREPTDRQPAPVAAGADGWLYELPDLELLHWMVGRRRLPANRVARWRQHLLDRDARCKELGVVYLVAVLPDRLLLYSEHVPTELKPAQTGRAVEVIAASLRDDNGLELLDLLPALRDARRHGQLVPRTASGLTWTGAFHAYRALAKELAKHWPAIQPLQPSALRLGVQVPVKQSLAARERYALVGGARVRVAVGAEPGETEADLVSGDLQATFAPLARGLEERVGPGASLLEVTDPEVAETAIVVHPGGAGRVAGLLAEHFARTLAAGSGEVPYRAAESESAAVVVELVDELRLCEG